MMATNSTEGLCISLATALQRTCYQIWMNRLLEDLMHKSYFIEPSDEIAVELVSGYDILKPAFRELHLFDKERLCIELNQQLRALHIDGYLVTNESEPDYRVNINGNVGFSVEYITHCSLEEAVSKAEKNKKLSLFIAHREYGEVQPSSQDTTGELWMIEGDQKAGEILWPFSISLEGVCIPLHKASKYLIEVENSEK